MNQIAFARKHNLPASLTISLKEDVMVVLRLIPSGVFKMGSAPEADGRYEREDPQHLVEIQRPFYLGQFPITQAQWLAAMGDNPAMFQGGHDLPIETVSWDACAAFCVQASQQTGHSIRLPSEAEWEYACRAGSRTTFNFGNNWDELDQHGWYRQNASHRSHPVGGCPANAWGLYDMHGGIDEFCQDVWHDDYVGAPQDGRAWLTGADANRRVLRGGSWYDEARHCRSSHRNGYQYNVPTEDHGFRIVVEILE